MANHVAKITPPRQPPNTLPAYMVHRTGENWSHTNKTKGEVTIHPGKMNAIIFPETGKSQEYSHLIKGPSKPKWTRAMENNIGRLFQGIRYIKGTETCFFIHRHKVPQESIVTYSRIVCDIIPQKKETHKVRLAVGGNKLTYDSPVSTPTANLTTSKLHWNSVLSTPDRNTLL